MAGSALATVASYAIGLNLGLALTFAISFLMLVTVVRLRTAMAKMAMKPTGKATVRVPKGDSATVEVETGAHRSAFQADALSVRPPPGVDVEILGRRGGSLELSVRPRYAGLFVGLESTYGFRDETGLFMAEKSFRLDSFRVESIPLNLVREVEAPSLAPVTFDENPAGVRGHGQELYALEEPQLVEARSVYWRGVARSPDGRMIVKVREGGLPETVTIGLVEALRLGVERLQWMDQASEALAKFGRILLRWGIGVTLVTASEKGTKVMKASSVSELSRWVIKIWEEPPSTAWQRDVIRRSDAVILESAMLSSPGLVTLLAEKPKLVIPLGGRPLPAGGII